MNKYIISAIVAASALLSGVNASAQNLQMSSYLGASGGVANWNVDCSGTTSCKKNPGSLRVFAGVNVMPNVAVELTYAALGTAKASATGVNAELKGSSVDLSGVYKFGVPTSPFGAFVKGGLAYTNAKTSATIGTASGSDTKKAWGLIVGAGVTYAVTESFAVRAEIDTQKLKTSTNSGNVTSFTVGGQATF
jgi:OOP family OmpA-OmpF porin